MKSALSTSSQSSRDIYIICSCFCVSLVATSYNIMLNSMLAMGCPYAISHACGIGQMLMTSEQLNVIKCAVLLKVHIKV